MKYFCYIFWFVVALFFAWVAGVYHGKALPTKYAQMPCADPYYDWGYDSPAMRVYMYGLNPNTCFKYKLTREPKLLGLAGDDYR